MADQVALAARLRAGSGKGEARALRREGRVPAIAYGADLDEPTAISVDALDLYHALHTDAGLNAIINLRVDEQEQLVIAREIQRHPVKRHFLHADFVTVSRSVKITVDVPVVTEGTAPGEEEGGVVEQQLHTVPVEVLPLEVPDQIVLDISDMAVGDVKRVADLVLPAGVESLEDPERTVVTLVVPALDVPDTEAGAPLEPLGDVEGAVQGAADTPEDSADATAGP
ncbi:MAG TPA: 50S ribosomal protein L25 [Egibacteraceae bacterium]|jgi:large subunit ribosomal protein L25|nr:50S ribosomal protein L25 [Egibacteraceae bacterium]